MIIPKSLQRDIMQELHKEHMGISRMKNLAQDHVWWLGIDKDLENIAKSCSSCAAVKQTGKCSSTCMGMVTTTMEVPAY